MSQLESDAIWCPYDGCLRLTKGGRFCAQHRRKTLLSVLVFVGDYKKEVLRKAIWLWKYEGVKDVGDELALLLSARLGSALPHKNCLIVPIPLYKRRAVYRGFDQSVQLAGVVGQILNLPVINALERVRATALQVQIKDEQKRAENVSGAFRLAKQARQLRGKTVILIDDVATTRATLEEVAGVLKAKGVRTVIGATVAKG